MRRVNAREAYEMMVREGYVYLDVRTQPEFAAGHPKGARNVPWATPGPDGLVPNGAFTSEVMALFERDTPLVVGCATGVRSRAASQLLSECGFEQLAEQRAGMDGLRDAFGRVQERGWRDEGLPIEYVDGDQDGDREEKS